MGLRICLAGDHDLDGVSSLFTGILESLPYYNDTAKMEERKKYTADALRLKLLEDRFSVIVAYENLRLAGYCMSRFDDYTVWLEWFGVDPSFRGRGIGGSLLTELERTAPLRGCHKVWCDSRTENKASYNVLMRNGYTLVATLNRHWYMQDFHIWEKQIIEAL